MRFRVQYSEWTGNIFVGNINKKGTEFLNKEDKTGEVLYNVVKLIEANDKEDKMTTIVVQGCRYILKLEKYKKEIKC